MPNGWVHTKSGWLQSATLSERELLEMGNLRYCCVGECRHRPAFLCDYPVSEGKTCDARLCSEHAVVVHFGRDVHMCPYHEALRAGENA